MARGGGSRRAGAAAGSGMGRWLPSPEKAEALEGLAQEGIISPWEIAKWRVSVVEAESAPHPHERVLLVPFMERGLFLPLHDFLRGLLFFYGL